MSYANVPIFPWQQQSTARDLIDQVQFFDITHEFHPLLGKVYELVDRRRTWGEDRVYYHDDAGKLCGMKAQWTSVADADPFVSVSAGRSSLHVGDLLQLVALIERLQASSNTEKPVKKGRKTSSKL